MNPVLDSLPDEQVARLLAGSLPHGRREQLASEMLRRLRRAREQPRRAGDAPAAPTPAEAARQATDIGATAVHQVEQDVEALVAAGADRAQAEQAHRASAETERMRQAALVAQHAEAKAEGRAMAPQQGAAVDARVASLTDAQLVSALEAASATSERRRYERNLLVSETLVRLAEGRRELRGADANPARAGTEAALQAERALEEVRKTERVVEALAGDDDDGRDQVERAQEALARIEEARGAMARLRDSGI